MLLATWLGLSRGWGGVFQSLAAILSVRSSVPLRRTETKYVIRLRNLHDVLAAAAGQDRATPETGTEDPTDGWLEGGHHGSRHH